MRVIKIQNENLKLTALLWLSLFIALTIFTSCGYLFGGKIQACQKEKPPMDHREIRPLALTGDLLLAPIALPIDFYTGGIYKPCNKYQYKMEVAKANTRDKKDRIPKKHGRMRPVKKKNMR
jgi:hypothetical protein